MKIRRGFISNSSSSSFVTVYVKTDLDDIHDDRFRIIGHDLWSGIDYFKPDAKTVEFLKEKGMKFVVAQDLILIKELFTFGEYNTIIEVDDFINAVKKYSNVNMEVIEVDYHSSFDWGSFKERYTADDN